MFVQTVALAGALAQLTAAAPAPQGNPYPTLVDVQALQDSISYANLLAGSQALEDIAYSTEGRNRAAGTEGHNLTVEYIFNELTALGTYDVRLQPFTAETFVGSATVTVNDESLDTTVLEYSPGGDVSGPLVSVSNLGCAATDFPETVAGSVALISRGECPFADKANNARAAGAVGVLIYNNEPGAVAGTLGGPGDFVPTSSLLQTDGQALAGRIAAGEALTASLSVTSTIEEVVTNNVIAETKSGQKDRIVALGAHTDSVPEGPGINDDGSGTIGILEVAKQLSKYTVTNAVRFGFWSAEESGLLGSTYYVSQLSEEEVAQHRLYLNFDMIASPNFAQFIYDGDGSAFGTAGPAGSAEIEQLFEEFYDNNGSPHSETAFDGRSDYGPFLDVGVPAGGLFTGAEGIKTEEEQALYGGEAGIAYDPNYHQAGDNVANLNEEAFTLNTKGIAYSVATYALSFDTLPAPTKKRQAAPSVFKSATATRRGSKWVI